MDSKTNLDSPSDALLVPIWLPGEYFGRILQGATQGKLNDPLCSSSDRSDPATVTFPGVLGEIGRCFWCFLGLVFYFLAA
jgi:hypothetical protein